MVESRSMVKGASPGPAPACHARASNSWLTRSSWRTWPHRKLRRKVPRVDGALTVPPWPLPVVVVNPRQVRDFAKATGTLAKTDTLDAGVLAYFADAVRPEVRPLKDAETQVLNSLTARRHQVMTMLVSEKNRLGTAIGAVSPRIEAHIAWLEQELSDLDKGLRQTLRRSPVWREKDDLLRTVPGVGEQLSLTLLANLPELGTLNSGRSPPLWAWLPTTATAATCGANAPSEADAPGCGPSSTWERW